jgi:hypothetical protein
VNEAQNNWVSKLKIIEAQMNNSLCAATKQALNEILYGKKVRLDLTTSLAELPAEADELTVKRETIRQDAARAIAFAQKPGKKFMTGAERRETSRPAGPF